MLRIFQRRGWVLAAVLVITTACAYIAASARGETYAAESTAVVSASRHGLLTPDQTTTLANTYALLIPRDAAILRSVATTLGTTVSDVQHRLSVFNGTGNGTGTALLTINYRGTSAANSIAGATATLEAIAGAHPVSRNIIPGSIGAVQAPTKASSSKGVAVLMTLGIIVGIALGLLLIVVWERVDPRIDRPEDLSQEVGSPTSPVAAISQSGVNALIARWSDLAEHEPSKIALVPVTADVQADLANVAVRFTQAQQKDAAASSRTRARSQAAQGKEVALPGGNGTPTSRTRARSQAAQPARNGTPTVIACEVPSVDLTALRPIMDSDLVVLVARRGTPRAALRELLDSLTEFGVSPKWAIFLGARVPGLQAGPEAR